MSTDIIEKLLKPIEGKQLEEDEMQDALTDTLTGVLPTDTKVYEEATKALLLVAPDLKEGALNNPRLGAEWLWTSLETQLKEQRDMMGKIALEVHRLILTDGQELEADELEMVAYCCIQLGESEREVEYTHRAKQIREQLKKSEITYER